MQKLYYGGDIITMVNESDAPEAILIEDGRIRHIGALSDARHIAQAPVEEINLRGNALMPSFIDGHSHLSLYSQFIDFPDLSQCASFDDIRASLINHLSDPIVQDRRILFAINYDHNFLEEQRHPTRSLLDQVSTDIPIWIYHVSSHMGVANTRLLQMVGLGERTDDPKGGHYGRFDDGTLNGYAEEIPAIGPILSYLFPLLRTDPADQLRKAQKMYLRHGVTTIQDGGAGAQAIEGFLKMAENHLFEADVVAYAMYTEHPDQLLRDHPKIARRYFNRFKLDGAKILLDGSPQGKSAWLTQPYAGEASYCGYGTLDDAAVEAAARSAILGRYQLLAHANGDAAADQFIRCYRRAQEACKMPENDLRPIMIHCQTVRDDQLAAMSQMGMLPSIFVAHTYFWGDVHLKNLGSARGNRISPVKAALENALPYNFHQDCPVLPPDMLRTVWCAVNRRTRSGMSIGSDQCIGTYGALKGITINAAYAYHEEAEKGTLEPGKLADMVILDQNPLKSEPMALKDIRVLETIKEGNALYTRKTT